VYFSVSWGPSYELDPKSFDKKGEAFDLNKSIPMFYFEEWRLVEGAEGLYCGVDGVLAGVDGVYAGVLGVYAGVLGVYAGVFGMYAGVVGAYAGV